LMILLLLGIYFTPKFSFVFAGKSAFLYFFIRFNFCVWYICFLFVLLLNKKNPAAQYRIFNPTLLKTKLWFNITFIRFMFNKYRYVLTSLVFTSSFIRKFIIIQFGKFKSGTIFVITN